MYLVTKTNCVHCSVRTGSLNVHIIKLNFVFKTLTCLSVQLTFLSPMAQQPPVGQSLLIIQSSRSYSDAPHSVEVLRTCDQPDTETSTCPTHSTHNRQTNMPSAKFEPAIPASDRPQSHTIDRAVTVTGSKTDIVM